MTVISWTGSVPGRPPRASSPAPSSSSPSRRCRSRRPTWHGGADPYAVGSYDAVVPADGAAFDKASTLRHLARQLRSGAGRGGVRRFLGPAGLRGRAPAGALLVLLLVLLEG